MRTSILVISIGVLLLILVGVTANIAIAKYEPFHPGEALFAAQKQAEQNLLALTFDRSQQAAYVLGLLERRSNDLRAAIGTIHEADALNALADETNQAVAILSKAPNQATPGLRNQLSVDLNAIQQTLEAFSSRLAKNIRFKTLQDLVASFMAIASDPTRPLSAILGGPVKVATASGVLDPVPSQTPTQLATPTEILISPQLVQFPPGSAGALHAFWPLTGKHTTAGCEACHTSGMYIGIPTSCTACHTKDAPPNHFQGECSLCHTTDAWMPATFNHAAVNAVDCVSCHTKDLPANHYPGQCSLCHTTDAWQPASFVHTAAAVDCVSCHTKDSPPNHFSGQCSECHSTSTWKNAVFNHAAQNATDCVACHTKDAPAGHFSGQCSECHSTSTWKNATFNHAAQNATDCINCHTKDAPANHFSGQCSECHSTSSWQNAVFNHAAQNATDCVSCHTKDAPANHFSGQCSECHSTSTWKNATFNHAAQNATDCVSCHTKDAPAGHFSGQCSECHTTTSWQNATFNHAAQNATDCISCHAKDAPANHFPGQCSQCHTTTSWAGATFTHTFPLNHGGANGQCALCHPSGTSTWTCFGCHAQARMDQVHAGIPNYATRCLECHPNGNGGG